MAALKTQVNNTYAPRVRMQTSGISMNQNQFDALVSLCYNCGGGNTMISNSPLVKYLKGELNESQARSQYSNYIVTANGQKLQGLVNRRNAEADLFFKDSPVPSVQNIVLTVTPGTNLVPTKFNWNEINGITRYGVRVYEADNWDNQYYAAWDHTGFDDSFQLPAGNYMAQAMYQIPDSDFVFGGIIYFSVGAEKPTLTVTPGTNLVPTKFNWNEINGITRYGVRVYEADNWDNQYYAVWDHTGFDDSFQLPAGNYMAQAMYQIPGSDFVFGGMIYFNVIDSKLTAPIISTDKNSYAVGEIINVSWTASPVDSILSHYWIVIKNPEGKEIIGETMGKNTSYSFNADKPGEYIIKTYATPMDSKEGEGSLTDTKTINVYLQGDINADEKFNVLDAVLLQKWLLAVPDTDLANWKAADLCEDDKLDVFDLCEMKCMLVENS